MISAVYFPCIQAHLNLSSTRLGVRNPLSDQHQAGRRQTEDVYGSGQGAYLKLSKVQLSLCRLAASITFSRPTPLIQVFAVSAGSKSNILTLRFQSELLYFVCPDTKDRAVDFDSNAHGRHPDVRCVRSGYFMSTRLLEGRWGEVLYSPEANVPAPQGLPPLTLLTSPIGAPNAVPCCSNAIVLQLC